VSSGDEPTGDDEPSRLGFAQTVTPAAGMPAVAAPSPAGPNTQDSDEIERPESDKLARAVAKSRIGAKLFAKKAEAVKLGRYHLLEMVGAGGMGVVWGAWDPELDRRVAIKLVKAEMQAARDRILIEGQALAKLSHPNVVPVYDVGVVDEQVYLVMEWVRGKNLRAWCRQSRSIHDIVAVYRAAGEGLSAAHRVGLIHRDFKPDNAMIGDDDARVRVLDFGLARGEVKAKPKSISDREGLEEFSSDLTRGAGTPRYMPPEQAEGAELTPAVDQYALGVSLREALVGRSADGKDADVPRWLDDILDRATAREASNRFPSMDALLHALSRDPRTIWRRRGIVAGVVALAGATFVVGSVRGGSTQVEKCAGAADEISKAWNPATSDKVIAHLTSLGAYGAEEAKRLVPDMATYSQRWAATHKRVCMANDRKELTPQLYDVRLACLARAQVALQTVTEILERSSKERLPDAVLASRALPEVELCATDVASSTIEAPPSAIKSQVDALSTEVSRIRYLALAIDPTAQELATDIAARADKLGYAPLIGRARLALGFGIIGDGKGAAQAIPQFVRARAAALQSGDLVTFVEAYAREVYAIGISKQEAKSVDVIATHQMVEDLAVGTKSAGVFARTLLLNNLGTQRLSSGDIPGARSFFERALAEPQLGKRDIELSVVIGNLAITTEDPQKRRALFLEGREHLERELGPNHPITIGDWVRGAHFLDNRIEATRELEDACTRLKTWHPDSQRRIESCSYELGWLAAERDDKPDMKAWMAAVQRPDNQYRKVAEAHVALAEGKPSEVAPAMETYGKKLAGDTMWWNRIVGADALLLSAIAYQALDQPARAAQIVESSLVVFDDPGFNKSASYYKRRLARARAMLAHLIAKSNPETAKSLANEALAWYRQAGGYDDVVAGLEAL
jgi:hypothetical protein